MQQSGHLQKYRSESLPPPPRPLLKTMKGPQNPAPYTQNGLSAFPSVGNLYPPLPVLHGLLTGLIRAKRLPKGLRTVNKKCYIRIIIQTSRGKKITEMP